MSNGSFNTSFLDINAGLFGTDNNSVSNTSGSFTNEQETEQSTSFLQELLNQLQSLEESNTSSTSDTIGLETSSSVVQSTSNALGEQSLSLLQGINQQLAGSLDTNVLERIDVNALRRQTVDDVISAGIAEVIAGNTNAGTFENSSVAVAAEQLGVEAATEGTRVAAEATAKNNESALSQQSNLQDLLAVMFNIEKGAETTVVSEEQAEATDAETTSQDTTGQTTSTSTETGTQSGQSDVTGTLSASGTSESETETDSSSGGLFDSLGF